MFDHLSGNIEPIDENRIVVDCGGVGFSVTVSTFACEKYAKMPQARVPVYLVVREDALELYGFKDDAERRLFTQLITVSGVGAKLAIAVLSGLSYDRIVNAIASTDAATLATIKGVGKKTAERIVLELKGKVEPIGGTSLDTPVPVGATDDKALYALVGLGYERKEAEAAIAKYGRADMTTEEIIRAVLGGNQ